MIDSNKADDVVGPQEVLLLFCVQDFLRFLLILILWRLLSGLHEHFADLTLLECECRTPVIRRAVLSHVEDGDHVPVRNEYVH